METMHKVNNRINRLFENKTSEILSIYFTGGHPTPGTTSQIISNLADAGVDLIEIGIPFSDPVADGSTIQRSCQMSLDQGMTVKKLLDEIKDIRKSVDIPLILMGSLNPIMRYGVETFCKEISEIGIDGLIIPDLPMYEYLEEYKTLFQSQNLHNTFLISPQTSESRIRYIDEQTEGFIYMVSSFSITGARSDVSEEQLHYFESIKGMNLKNPRLIGFGISNKETFDRACAFANGAIIGSAFVKHLEENPELDTIEEFIKSIRL